MKANWMKKIIWRSGVNWSDEFYQKILLEFHEKGTDFLLPLQLPSFWCCRPFNTSICCFFSIRCSWLRIAVSWMLQRAFMLLCVAISHCRLLFIFNINSNRTNHLTKLRLKRWWWRFCLCVRREGKWNKSSQQFLISFSNFIETWGGVKPKFISPKLPLRVVV